jgi:hypothetical protein
MQVRRKMGPQSWSSHHITSHHITFKTPFVCPLPGLLTAATRTVNRHIRLTMTVLPGSGQLSRLMAKAVALEEQAAALEPISAPPRCNLWGAVTHLRLKMGARHITYPRDLDWGELAKGMPRLKHLELANMRLACSSSNSTVFPELTHMALQHVRVDDCGALRQGCAGVTHLDVSSDNMQMEDMSDVTLLLEFAPQLVEMRWGTRAHIRHDVADVARVLARCGQTLQVLCVNGNVDGATLKVLASMPRLRMLEICEFGEDASTSPQRHPSETPPPSPSPQMTRSGCDTLSIHYASASTIRMVMDWLRPATSVVINKELSWEAQDDADCLAAAAQALAVYRLESLHLCTYHRTPPPLRALQPLGQSLTHLTLMFDGNCDNSAVTHEAAEDLGSSLPLLQTLTMCMDCATNTYVVTPAFWMEMIEQCPPRLTTIRLDRFSVRTISTVMAFVAFLDASSAAGQRICVQFAHSSDCDCYDELEPAPLDYVEVLADKGYNVQSVEFVPVSRLCTENRQ